MPSDTVLEKATRLYNLNRVTPTDTGFLVEGDTHTYTVTILDGGTCTCPAGMNRRSCSHVEAVWLEIRWGNLHRAIRRGLERTETYDNQHKETP